MPPALGRRHSAQKLLLDDLGVKHLVAVAGPSYGRLLGFPTSSLLERKNMRGPDALTRLGDPLHPRGRPFLSFSEKPLYVEIDNFTGCT
jgi:hypothetical protein